MSETIMSETKKQKKVFAFTAAIIAACAAVVLLLIFVIIPTVKYHRNLAAIQKDGTVTFGHYEQDNDTSNGKEEIEWQVLVIQDGKALVISTMALDCKSYHPSPKEVTWETCTLRTWLNDSFLNTAFSAKEQKKIATTHVSAEKNPAYDPAYKSNPGNATNDKVFLLSITEAEKYFTTDESRECVPTAYAQAHGAYTNDYETANGKANCCWWLRSPGKVLFQAASVDHVGAVGYGGSSVNADSSCIRPAMWIDLKK